MGHSAGGHLAFWLADSHHIPPHSPVLDPQPHIPLLGAIALAGAGGLRLTIDLSGYSTFAHDKPEVYALMGGPPPDLNDRYEAGNPGDLLQFNAPQILIQGTDDIQIPPELPFRWAEMSRRMGDPAIVTMFPSADHLDIVDQQSQAWTIVRDVVRKMAFS